MRLLCVNVDVREISSVEAMLSNGRWVCSPDHVHHYWREIWEHFKSILQRQESDLAGVQEACG